METTKNMTRKNLMVLLVSALFVLAAAQVVSAQASPLGSISKVEVAGIEVGQGNDLSLFAGEQVPVLVVFTADFDAEDVNVEVRLAGEDFSSNRPLQLIAGKQYSERIYVDVPHDIDDDNGLAEDETLRVTIDGDLPRDVVPIVWNAFVTTQREAYDLEILSVDMQTSVNTGDTLVIDTVLKNRGSQQSEDTFVKVSVPELGLSDTSYFGDLTPVDRSNPDKEDALERRSYIRIPVNAPAGLYTVRIEAYSDDSFAVVERKILVDGAEENSLIVPSTTTQTFAVGETAEYELLFVNRGNQPLVYRLDANSASSELTVDVSPRLFTVPAGGSQTVSIFAEGSQRDNYAFSVTVRSEEGIVLDEQTFVANVMDNGRTTSNTGRGSGINADTTVLLTVILAIVFVVLLVVLIVLLTRKPETKEEFGESYY